MARTQLVRCILLFLISLSYTSCFHATSRLHQSPQRQRRLYLYSTISEQQLSSLSEKLAGLNAATTGRQATRIIEDAGAKLWNTTRLSGSRRTSSAELRMLTKIDGDVAKELGIYGDKDTDRIAAALGAVVVGAMLSGVATAQALPGPPIFRFCAVWLCAFSPYIFLTVGLQLPSTMQWALVQTQRALFPSFRQRLLFHEAGHFLCGYLCGMPIEDYSANSIVNAVQFYPLSDKTRGPDLVKQLGFTPTTRGSKTGGKLFELDGNGKSTAEDEEGFMARAQREREQERDVAGRLVAEPNALSSEMDPRESWPYRGISHDTLDVLSVVSLGGVMAEMIEFGDGEGGYADLSQLQGLLAAAEPPLENDREEQDRVRWAAVQAYTILKLNHGALAALAEAIDRRETVPGCILAIEECLDPRGESEEFAARRADKPRGILDGYLRRPRIAKRQVVSSEPKDEEYTPLIDEDEVLALAAATTAGFLTLVLSGVLRI